MKHLAIKVTNKYESEAVQKALFDMGFKWTFGEGYYIREIIICSFNNMSITDFISYRKNLTDEINYSDFEVEVSFSDFFSTYAGHIERFPDYVESKKQEPKFKAGDYLYQVTHDSSLDRFLINKFPIIEISKDDIYEVSVLSEHIANSERSILYNTYLAKGPIILVKYIDIDKPNGRIFSTPELAAKRFLELNK